MTAIAWTAVAVLLGFGGWMIYSIGYVSGYQAGSNKTALEFTLRLGRKARHDAH